jgi:hypothetical protein
MLQLVKYDIEVKGLPLAISFRRILGEIKMDGRLPSIFDFEK